MAVKTERVKLCWQPNAISTEVLHVACWYKGQDVGLDWWLFVFQFDRGLSDLLHSEVHWLDIYQRVQYKLGVTIYRCLQNRAPQYLVDCCVRTSDVFSCQRLRSANRRQLVVPRHRRSKFGRRLFSIAALIVWNSFPDSLRDPTMSIDNFRSTLKTHLFVVQRDT